MFYIDKRPQKKKREALLVQILPTILVFSTFAILTLLSWGVAKDAVKDEQQKSLQQRNSDAATFVRQRMDSYENILRGSAGLFNASNEVTRTEWNQYLTPFDLVGRYPGISGVGYVAVVPAADLPAHMQAVRNQGLPDYTVYPSGERAEYASILYLETQTEGTPKAIGFDMYTDPVRREAMIKARDSGQAVLSNNLRLLTTDQSTTGNPGFIMVLPVYRRGSTPTTAEERQRQLQGYIYAPFRSFELIHSILANQGEHYGFEVYNLNGDSEELLYKSENFDAIQSTASAQKLNTELNLPGTTWRVVGVVNREIVSVTLRNRPTTALWGGLVFSAIVSGFIYLLLLNRSRALALKEETNVQNAKDELLALASHQLRTPATGVKQYVGMLREGLAGKVTTKQQKLLNKAYESNERQLGIINEMLFVARADAGGLKLEKKRFELNILVKDIADEQGAVMGEQGQVCRLRIPKKAVHVTGDRQYIRMAFENIISNATKYTRSGGHISISLKQQKNLVIFRVKDDGVGVAQKDFPLLFNKFSRIPNELTGKVSGSGMGLYLAKQIIDAHKGTIVFESKKAAGSVVTVTLPKNGRN